MQLRSSCWALFIWPPKVKSQFDAMHAECLNYFQAWLDSASACLIYFPRTSPLTITSRPRLCYNSSASVTSHSLHDFRISQSWPFYFISWTVVKDRLQLLYRAGRGHSYVVTAWPPANICCHGNAPARRDDLLLLWYTSHELIASVDVGGGEGWSADRGGGGGVG